MGEELGASGEREGSGREKEEGAGEDLPRLARHPPTRGARRSARGRPAPPRPRAWSESRPWLAKCVYTEGRQKSRPAAAVRAARPRSLEHLLPFCHVLPYRPRQAPSRTRLSAGASAHQNPAYPTAGARGNSPFPSAPQCPSPIS